MAREFNAQTGVDSPETESNTTPAYQSDFLWPGAPIESTGPMCATCALTPAAEGTSRTYRLSVAADRETRLSDPGRQERGNGGVCVRRGPDADTRSRQTEAVWGARPRWRAKNRVELSRSYSGSG